MRTAHDGERRILAVIINDGFAYLMTPKTDLAASKSELTRPTFELYATTMRTFRVFPSLAYYYCNTRLANTGKHIFSLASGALQYLLERLFSAVR